MDWRGMIITGTSGAGKSTLTKMLRARDASFELVQAVTTRQPREDDEPGNYEYLSEEDFEARREDLIIWAEYRGKRYGITRAHVAGVEGRGKSPLLVITPRSLAEFLERSREDGPSPFLAVFIDAPDEELDARLGLRGDSDRRPAVVTQRAEDRGYASSCNHVLQNCDLDRSLTQLLGWWGKPPDSPEETKETA